MYYLHFVSFFDELIEISNRTHINLTRYNRFTINEIRIPLVVKVLF